MARICILNDDDGDIVYPRTLTDAVLTKDGTALSGKIDNMAILGSPIQTGAEINLIDADLLGGHTKDYFATKEETTRLESNVEVLNNRLYTELISIEGSTNQYLTLEQKPGYIPISVTSISVEDLYTIGIAVNMADLNNPYKVHLNRALTETTYGFYVTWLRV